MRPGSYTGKGMICLGVPRNTSQRPSAMSFREEAEFTSVYVSRTPKLLLEDAPRRRPSKTPLEDAPRRRPSKTPLEEAWPEFEHYD